MSRLNADRKHYRLRTLLQECARDKKPDDFLFTRQGKPIREFRKAWRKLCIAAGVGHRICCACQNVVTDSECSCGSRVLRYEGLMVHDLRRTAARNLRRAGVAEGVIMKMGGWKTRSVFERYNIVDQRDMRDALSKLAQQQQELRKQQQRAQRKKQFGHDSAMIARKPVQQPLAQTLKTEVKVVN
jgi:integrase